VRVTLDFGRERNPISDVSCRPRSSQDKELILILKTALARLEHSKEISLSDVETAAFLGFLCNMIEEMGPLSYGA